MAIHEAMLSMIAFAASITVSRRRGAGLVRQGQPRDIVIVRGHPVGGRRTDSEEHLAGAPSKLTRSVGSYPGTCSSSAGPAVSGLRRGKVFIDPVPDV